MKNLLKFVFVVFCLCFTCSIQAQFAITAGPSFPLCDFSSSNEDFGNGNIGVCANLQGAMPLFGNADILGNMFAITLNVDYFWHTIDKNAKTKILNEYLQKSDVTTYSKMTHKQYMFLPIMVGFLYRYNVTNNFAITLDAACGVNFIYRTKEEFDYTKNNDDFQFVKEYQLAYGVAAKASFHLIILKHWSLGANLHLLSSFTNNYSTYLKLADNSETRNNISYSSDKGFRSYPMTVSATIGYVF